MFICPGFGPLIRPLSSWVEISKVSVKAQVKALSTPEPPCGSSLKQLTGTIDRLCPSKLVGQPYKIKNH